MPGAVNFYLKKAEKTVDKKPGKSLIYLKYKYNGRVLVYSFGQTIYKDNWNAAKQRVKSNRETTSDGKHSLNDLLDNLAKVLEKAYNTEIKNGIPLPVTLKKYLSAFINQNKDADEIKKQRPGLFHLIDRFISGEIKGKKGKEHSRGSMDGYAAAKKHLLAFQVKYNYTINFDTITLDFFNTYTTFLKKVFVQQTKGPNPTKKVGLGHNTIAKDISLLKVFMNKAVALGMTNNLAHQHEDFSFTEVETDAVYVKENELITLFDFTIENSKLEETKDLFIFGSFTGMRFSDYSDLGPENIIEESGEQYIKRKTQKTEEVVYIPCHPIVLRIFDKYSHRHNKLPKTISNQKFNDYIKEVFKQAGFTEKGRLHTAPGKELWECISSHTARRSFATNLFLDGIEPRLIMRITGHKTEKAFMKYIRVSKLDTAKKIGQHMKETWSKKLLKIA